MHFTIRNKEALGIAVLLFGLALLGFTFYEAYVFLLGNVQITGTEFTDVFGSSIGALITACIKIIYLGVMVWIGALVTARAVTILQLPKSEEKPKDEKQAEKQSVN
jgi:uncharacterized protein with PQ loop repeat